MFIDQSGHQKNTVVLKISNMWVCNKVNIYIYVDQSGHHKNRVKNMWVYNKVNVYRSECPSEEKG